MTWSITVAERPVDCGPLDYAAFGKRLAHGFFRFKDDTGTTILELHGFEKVHVTGKHASLKARAIMAAAFVVDNIAGRALNMEPLLQVKAVTSPQKMAAIRQGLPVHEEIIFQGSKKEILSRMEAGLAAADLINKAKLPFVLFWMGNRRGQNCQTVKSIIERIMIGEVLPENIGYAMPGMENDLAATIPQLRGVVPDKKASLQQLYRQVGALLQDANVNPYELMLYRPSHRASGVEAAAGLHV